MPENSTADGIIKAALDINVYLQNLKSEGLVETIEDEQG